MSIIIQLSIERKNSSGSGVTTTQKIKINNSDINSITGTTINNASLYYITQKQILHVVNISGNNLTFRTNGLTLTAVAQDSTNFALGTTGSTSGTSLSDYTLGSIDKTAIITIKTSLQFATANSNTFLRIQSAQAYIIKKAV